MPLISNTSGKRKYLSLLFLFNCRVRNALTLNSLGYEMPGVRNAWGTKSLGYETPSTKRLVTKRLGYETFGTRAVDVQHVVDLGTESFREPHSSQMPLALIRPMK